LWPPRSEALQMNNSELKHALRAHEQAIRNVKSEALAVWEALSRADPELAAEIVSFFSDVEAAADWATSDLDDFEGSPAHQVAEGRTAEVLARLRKAAHAFPG
jgi:hypothetical protein